MDHYQIATQLGKIPLLCVGFMYDSETNEIVPEFSTLTYEGKSPTTKLQLAAISAMPNDALNHFDLRDLQIMGYSGRLDVRKRISRHNTLYPHEPIPMIK